MYDSSKGAFVDLSVLDVLQIFGRAGRPGMEDSGEGYICTSEDKLAHYLDSVTAQVRTLLPDLLSPIDVACSILLNQSQLPFLLMSLVS